MASNLLHWADYVIFGTSLAVAVIVGMISAWKYRKQASLEDYILGKRRMSPVVVALSMIASLIDASVLLLSPTEVYLFGAISSLGVIGMAMSIFVAVTFFLPTYHSMKLTSAYEYVEVRFMTQRKYLSRILRMAASLFYGIDSVLASGLILYIPALAFTQVAGVDLWASVLICGIPCVAYTTVGGLRAVIWVDSLQMIVMLSGMLLFIIIGSVDAGGGHVIVRNVKSGGRFNFDILTLDPRVRYTVWTVTIGQFVNLLSGTTAGQMQVQRYMAVQNIQKAKRVGLLSVLLVIPVMFMSTALGLVVYGYYYGCDPISAEQVDRAEQLIPHFMMDIVGHLHGLPGLYMSALFAAAMSTLSSAINAVCALSVQDFVRPAAKAWKNRDLTDREAMNWCTVLSLITGCLGIGAAFLPDAMGGLVIEISRVFRAGLISPIFVLFVLGLFIPWADIWGAYAGGLSAMALGLWLGIGNTLHARLSRETLPLSRETCNTLNNTVTSVATTTYYSNTGGVTTEQISLDIVNSEPFFQPLYDVSFGWFALYTSIFGVLVGSTISFITSGCSCSRRPNIDKSLMYDYSSCCSYCTNIDSEVKQDPTKTVPLDDSHGGDFPHFTVSKGNQSGRDNELYESTSL